MISFYKALQQAMDVSRIMRYYWKDNGLSDRAKEWLAAHAELNMHEGQHFLSFHGEDHPVGVRLYSEIQSMQADQLKASVALLKQKESRKTTER